MPGFFSGAYELLDFGDGRKLERFGPWVLDRPAPGADGPQAHPALWKSATARYTGERATTGTWAPAPAKWVEPSVELPVQLASDLRFEMLLAPLPSGQVGVFWEQFMNWQWIARSVARCRIKHPDRSPPRPALSPEYGSEGSLSFAKPPAAGGMRVLNLFGYTGGSTLVAAGVGAEVTHVDAAKGIVARARENATLSGLADAPIRWIVEDALKFCQREVKRGRQYDAVILDPPTYGHGPQGEAWSIERDLLPLLDLCRQLTAGRLRFALLTCHTPGLGPAELSAYLSDGLFGHCGQPPQCGKLYLETADGRRLLSGDFARWPG